VSVHSRALRDCSEEQHESAQVCETLILAVFIQVNWIISSPGSLCRANNKRIHSFHEFYRGFCSSALLHLAFCMWQHIIFPYCWSELKVGKIGLYHCVFTPQMYYKRLSIEVILCHTSGLRHKETKYYLQI
jgi:hypothetical protein